MAATYHNTVGGGPRLKIPLPRNTSSKPTLRMTNKTNKTADGGSRFTRLPAELRNKIYEYTLSDTPRTIKVSATGFKVPGLLRVNRQIRSETRAMYFSKHDFEIPMSGNDDLDCELLSKLLRSFRDLKETPFWSYDLDPNFTPNPNQPFWSSVLLGVLALFVLANFMYFVV